VPSEYAVKANFLYKFAPFVQWPPSAFETSTAPVTICIAGQDPFGSALDAAVRRQKVNGHPIVVRRLAPAPLESVCHILFAAGSENGREWLRSVAGRPVLTVTDGSRGVSGGMIQFVTIGRRVRFTIDEAAAQQSGILISSKLLDLAVRVTR